MRPLVALLLVLPTLVAGCATMGARSDHPCGVALDATPAEVRAGETVTIVASYRNCTPETIHWEDGGCGFAPRLNGTHHLGGAARMQMCTAMILPYELRAGKEIVVRTTWNGTFEEQGRTWTDAEGVQHADLATWWRAAEPGAYTVVLRAGDAHVVRTILLR